MSEEVIESNEASAYLGMSDAEVLAAGAPTSAPVVVEEIKEEVLEAAPEVVVPEEEQANDDGADENREAVTEKPAAEPENKESKPVVEQAEESAFDYEAEYKRLLAPFKANGRDISVTSVDDAISLMQMGANYNKKMAGLKPNLKLMKLLENNNLLSEDKISFLIELEKKNPDAINKLVKDSGINPMDFDADKAGEYKPKIHTVDDRELDLDTVLDEIQSTPTYNRTLEVVSKEWDGASKQVIAATPQLLKVINGHVASGIYDQISKEVESERMFGRLTGLSDIEAYRQVGDAINARGGFNNVAKPTEAPTQRTVVVPPKPKKAEDDKLNDKRRAASSTKPAVSAPVNNAFNPLSMSDAEFSKLLKDKLL